MTVLTTATRRPMDPKFRTVPCWHFAKGFCERGADCSFSHESVPPGQEVTERRGSVVCRHWSKGYCMRGEACNFAHGEQEPEALTRKRPNPFVMALPAAKSCRTRTEVCRHFARGYCALANRCLFAHEDVTMGWQPTTFIKTKLCRHFENGLCARGNACCFAHGEGELGSQRPGQFGPGQFGAVQIPVPWMHGYAPQMEDFSKFYQKDEQPEDVGRPLLKIKLCRHFEHGYCMRGNSCCFAHGERELGAPRPAVPANAACNG